jgi:GH15 family glucan-1,4-alpha-glucosidase
MRRGYLPIQDYGIIGDMHSIALIGKNGSLDWCCLPRFDSPSLFAAILDDEKGGSFQITPATEWTTHRQFYWPETNVLVTRFVSTEGVSEIIDYMPVGESRAMYGHSLVVRTVKVIQGTVSFKLNCRPAFNYARDEHHIHFHDDGVLFESADSRMALSSNIPLRLENGEEKGGVRTAFTLDEGQDLTFALRLLEEGTETNTFSREEAQVTLNNCISFWRRWLSQCTYSGRWRETVHRSALTLKLLTYEPTGAIVAAPTCSLPESIGGARNWDYRYTWIRDAAFTLYGLLRIGFTEEAASFIWPLNHPPSVIYNPNWNIFAM